MMCIQCLIHLIRTHTLNVNNHVKVNNTKCKLKTLNINLDNI